MMFTHAGKRSALGVGIRAAKHEILVLTDSDTRWEPGLLAHVQMPFVDPRVGGVSTRQNVYQPRRASGAASPTGSSTCATSTTCPRPRGAVASSASPAAPRPTDGRRCCRCSTHLENEFFLGRRCVAGDDGRLTWLVLAQGYRTEHQDSARALSMFPSTFRAFCKQRVRWSRNSYRCYLTAITNGWLWHQPLISQLTVFQILFTPVTMFATVWYLVVGVRNPQPGLALTLGAAWLLVGRAIRSFSHLRRRPTDLLILPLVTVVITMVALPIKTYAFVTMNKQGWLTRRADLVGGEGQDAASLAKGSRHVA